MIRDWLRRLLDLDRRFAHVHTKIDILYKHDLLPQNMATRISAAENSLRLIESRLKLIEGLEWADGTVGEHAARKATLEQVEKQHRLDESAAKVRGMSLDEYKADVARRKAEKAKNPARETIEGETT